jgi:ribosomal protein S18 acetylase RimI-like enzyme
MSPTGFALAYRFPCYYKEEHTAYLYDIEVLPTHRRKGIASRLINELKIHLKNDDVHEIWLGTGIENIAVQKLFDSTGAEKEQDTFYEYFYLLR